MSKHKINTNFTNQPDVTLYDKYNYDYSTYWTSRTYEHEAEVFALKRLLSKSSGTWFVDIGGSYGRHIPLYQEKYKKCVLLDYSLNSLRRAKEALAKNNISNVFPIAANAYHLPFKQSVFDGGMMIRVIHHIENPDVVISEISRTFRTGGTFILEFPNKIHIKSIIKAIFRGDFAYLTSKQPVQVQMTQPEGSQKTDPGIMLNFAPQYIREILLKRNIIVTHISAVSFLRIPALKRLIGTKSLTAAEKMLQRMFGRVPLTPSIILSSEVFSPSKRQEVAVIQENLEDILACPACTKPLRRIGDAYNCASCSNDFPIRYGIPDLRYPKEPFA